MDKTGAPHLGAYFPFVERHAAARPMALSYLAKEWGDRHAWADQCRAKMAELLAYQPEPAPRGCETVEETRCEGYTRLRVRFHVTNDRTTESFLLIPRGLNAPAPAVVALHDHGAFYYYGKEKICESGIKSGVLSEHTDKAYGGRMLADTLAWRGFVVLVPDAFYFGSQRPDPDAMPEHNGDALRDKQPGSDGYISEYNQLALRHEELVAKTLFTAGTTWPGVLFQGDRAAVDYLLTRPEVDPSRIGCIGLSIGGFRSAHLFGLDPRIKAAVVAGWMTTYESLLYDHLLYHTWMIYVPRQLEWLDLPDVATINAPNPLMVINCLQDELFTREGMADAEKKIAAVYDRMGARDRFLCRYDDEPHSLKVPAQDAAIEWLQRWLV